jgi:hypothetical protein
MMNWKGFGRKRSWPNDRVRDGAVVSDLRLQKDTAVSTAKVM